MHNINIFEQLCDDSKWKIHSEFFQNIEERVKEDIRKASEENVKIAKQVREAIENDKNITLKKVTKQDQDIAENKLLTGEVVGVDGTQTYYPMLSGGRAQVAVATVSYSNKKFTTSVYLSEHDFRTTSDDLMEALRQRRPSNIGLTQLAIRALMRYKEIEIGINRKEPWILFNGSYFPYELRSGAGSLRVVRKATKLLRETTARGTVASIVAKSKDWHILSLGLGLKDGEYLHYDTLNTDLDTFLNGNSELGISPANLRGDERLAFESFTNEVAPLISMGLVKIGARSYLFQAPSEHFDEAANIIIRDGHFQPIRGYPMLIDYADSLLAKLSSGGDFIRMIEHKLQKNNNLLPEMDEHDLRRR